MSSTPRKKAVVTGATGGIGSVIVQTILQREYDVLALGFDQNKLEALADNLDNPTGLYIRALDFNVQQNPEALFRLLDGVFLRYDLLVTAHCARPSPPMPSDRLSYETWQKNTTLDLVSVFQLFQALLPLFSSTASVTFLSSFHAFGTYPQRVIYATMKAAICGMARALAVEYAPRGIRVNAIAPGQVEGGRTDWFLAQQGANARDRMLARSPSGQIVQPEDIARTVLWLANTPSMTGQTIIMDHGWSVDFSYDKTMEG